MVKLDESSAVSRPLATNGLPKPATRDEYDKLVSSYKYRSVLERWLYYGVNVVMGPVFWFRKNVVEPHQKHYPWYHRRYRRVLTIDQCYDGDRLCEFEANEQYLRDRAVEESILIIMKRRHEDCVFYHSPDNSHCDELYKVWDVNRNNYFIKYGDQGVHHDARRTYMKQKHRMVWERRHGPVGSGMNPKFNKVSE